MGHKIRANRAPITKAALLAYNLDQKFKYAAPHRVYPTTSEWVGFMKIDRDWRFVALDGDLKDSITIGLAYPTRKALIADMARYIRESGY
jgi:hypothetical protein